MGYLIFFGVIQGCEGLKSFLAIWLGSEEESLIMKWIEVMEALMSFSSAWLGSLVSFEPRITSSKGLLPPFKTSIVLLEKHVVISGDGPIASACIVRRCT